MKFANLFGNAKKLNEAQTKVEALEKEVADLKRELELATNGKLAAQEKSLKLEQTMSELVGLVEDLPKSARKWTAVKKMVLCLEANGLRVVYPADAE